METLLKDLRYGYRTLIANPGFTLIAVLSLALGIGANTAIFSFIDTVMLKSLPVAEPERLYMFGEGKSRGNNNEIAQGARDLFSWREYRDFRAANRVFEDILAVDSNDRRIYATFNGDREPVLSTFVSSDYFRVFGLVPQAGQFFDNSVDDAPVPRAVLSDSFWARRFHRDPSVIGSVFRANGRDYSIVGIAPRGFFGARVAASPDLWIPISMAAEFPSADLIQVDNPKDHFLDIIGRLKPGITPQQAEAAINIAYQAILPRYKGGGQTDPREDELIRTAVIKLNPAGKGFASFQRRYGDSLVVLMIVVALVLLIACANVANLLVAMGARRQREMALRLAIGAGRGRLIRQLLTEGILLSGAGGLLGILFAINAGRILVHLISTTGPTPVPLTFELNAAVLTFTIGLSLLTGIVFSLAPAWRASRLDLSTSLKEGKNSTAAPGKVTFGRLMVISQVALSLALLITAGMLVHSFENLVTSDTGFDREHVLIFKIDSESAGYKQGEALAVLYRRIVDSVAHVPGTVAGSVSLRSFHEGSWIENIKVPGKDLSQEAATTALNFVTPGFFRTFGIQLLAGRALQDSDNAAAPLVAVVDETFARKVFGNENPVGRIFQMAPLTEKIQSYTVIGVVRPIKTVDVRETPRNSAWLALAQGPTFAGNIAVRISGNPAEVSSRIRAAIRAAEPNLPIRYVTTLADEVSESLIRERALAQLSGFFAALALLLSAIGLYGTISFTVARRTSEIGIRIALGAKRSGVLGMVLKDAMTLVALGVVIGIPLALVAGRVLGNQLFGLGSFDAVSAIGAIVSLAVVAAVAGYVPARRAARTDPMIALRYE